MTKKKKIIVITSVALAVVIIALSLGLGLYFGLNALPRYKNMGEDKIHFINTRNSDAILIESNGHFALVDCAEDSDNPRGFGELNLKGYEQEVLRYLKHYAADANGKVVLDFVLGTHSHSDHLGGFDTVISDTDITVKQAYVKEYRAENIREYEREHWDNQEVFDQMISACAQRGVPVEYNLPTEPFKLGNLDIQFYNTEYDLNTGLGENDNAIGTLIVKGNTRAFLSADIDNLSGDEDRLARVLGKVDLLKLGHHGYEGSNTENYINTLSPDYAIVTNTILGVYAPTKRNLKKIGAKVHATYENNGLVAVFSDEGGFDIYNKSNKF